MPATVNGIGTTYYGKKNLETRADFCEHCHRRVDLQSYDTRLWFVVLFIPIIPLGRKRVLDYCPACRRHRVIDLDKWERAKQSNLATATEKFKANPTPEAAVELHSLLLGFHQSAQAAEFRKFMREKFADHAKVQAYLGQVWRDLGQPDEAGPCFQRALKLDPNLPAAKAGVAQDLIRQGKLDEARRLLAFLEAPDAVKQHPLGPLNELALAYQQAGQHKEALELFRKLIAAVPDLARDKDYRKVVRASEAALGPGPSTLPPPVRPWRKIIGWSTAASLALIAAFGSNLYIANHRTVHVVNGFDKPVTLIVPNHGSVTVGRGGYSTLRLPEGTHRVAFDGAVKQEAEVSIQGSFFERWSGKTVFVLNPGGAAMLLWEQTTYAKNPEPTAQHPFRVHFGEVFREFRHIDYVFEPFPKSIQTKTHSETRTRLDMLHAEPVGVFVALLSRRDYSEALRLAEWSLRLQPATNLLLVAYISVAKAQKHVAQAAALLRAGLERRPVDMAWHRAYQELLAEDREGDQLMSEYDGYLRSEPDSSALLYLRGRLSTNQQEADSYFQRALAADPNNAYAHNAAGFRKATLGDWAGARQEINRARELAPDEQGFAEALREARMARGEFADMEQELRSHLARNPLDQYACLELCDVLAAQGKDAEARQLIAAYEREVSARFKQEAADPIRTVRRHLLYSIGDFAGLEKASMGDLSPEGRRSLFHALIETGRVADAAKLFPLNDPKTTDPWHYLTASLAWHRAGDLKQAAAWSERAAELFAGGRREWRSLAELLRKTTPTPLAQLMDLPIAPKSKAILFAALAQGFPAQSAELLAKARLFNVERSYPYHLVRRACEERK